MCEMTAMKTGMLTTISAAVLTAGAIGGTIVVGGMGLAAVSTALMVASVALGIFTLWSALTVAILKCVKDEDQEDGDIEEVGCKAFFYTFAHLPCFIAQIFCCCCRSEEKDTSENFQKCTVIDYSPVQENHLENNGDNFENLMETAINNKKNNK